MPVSGHPAPGRPEIGTDMTSAMKKVELIYLILDKGSSSGYCRHHIVIAVHLYHYDQDS